MKHCPQCNRTEAEDTLTFCRVDGTPLVRESGAVSEGAGTLRFSPEGADTGETRILPTGEALNKPTARTTVLESRPASGSTRGLSRSKSRRGVVLVAAAIVAIALAAAAFYSLRKDATAIESVAVMPFVNETGIQDAEYLSDGMTETLISALSQLPNLNVKPRSSVFRYKSKETDPQTIGKELNVQAILNGRVVQRGQDISLFVELIDVSLDKVIWSETYNRKQSDLVTLQTDIARDVSSKLKTKLSGAEIAKVEKTYTTNPEAYQLYLKGRYHATRYTEEGFRKGIEYFNQAIAIDPTYALAYDGLAYCYYTSWYIPAKEGSLKAKAAAMKALEIDPSFAEAHASLANIYFWNDYDWAAAEREYLDC